jgi:hypothetical protein
MQIYLFSHKISTYSKRDNDYSNGGYITKLLEECSFTYCNPHKVSMIGNLKLDNEINTPINRC